MNDGKVVFFLQFSFEFDRFSRIFSYLDVNMERYAEEYDVAIVGGGPDILFLRVFLSVSSFFSLEHSSFP